MSEIIIATLFRKIDLLEKEITGYIEERKVCTNNKERELLLETINSRSIEFNKLKNDRDSLLALEGYNVNSIADTGNVYYIILYIKLLK